MTGDRKSKGRRHEENDRSHSDSEYETDSKETLLSYMKKMERRLNERINKMEQYIMSMPDMVKEVVREKMITLEERICEVKTELTECMKAVDSKDTEIEGKTEEHEKRVKALEESSQDGIDQKQVVIKHLSVSGDPNSVISECHVKGWLEIKRHPCGKCGEKG